MILGVTGAQGLPVFATRHSVKPFGLFPLTIAKLFLQIYLLSWIVVWGCGHFCCHFGRQTFSFLFGTGSNIFGDCCRLLRSHFVRPAGALPRQPLYQYPGLASSPKGSSRKHFSLASHFLLCSFCHYPAKNHILCAICFPRFLFAPWAPLAMCVCLRVCV